MHNTARTSDLVCHSYASAGMRVAYNTTGMRVAYTTRPELLTLLLISFGVSVTKTAELGSLALIFPLSPCHKQNSGAEALVASWA